MHRILAASLLTYMSLTLAGCTSESSTNLINITESKPDCGKDKVIVRYTVAPASKATTPMTYHVKVATADGSSSPLQGEADTILPDPQATYTEAVVAKSLTIIVFTDDAGKSYTFSIDPAKACGITTAT